MRVVLTAVLCFNLAGFAQSSAAQAQKDAADTHAVAVDQRGDHAMGFSHQTTRHHFVLLKDGGVIEVETREGVDDDATRDQIRTHLKHIAAMFTAGEFEIPMFIHDRVPPGVPVMKAKRDAITYEYQATSRGGKVRIVAADADAIKAVHEFLKFQIEDHRTGDRTEISPSSR